MKKIIRFFPGLLILSIFCQPLFSQTENLKIEHISLEQGVSNNLIYSICQDSKGFLWFGTMFGLVRYDGINYKTYHYDPLDTNSLSNDDVISIYEDKSGSLWIGTYNGGLNKYDRITGKFTRYLYNPDNPNSINSNTVWVILQDSKGAMWFGTEGGGLNKFDNDKFIAYKKDTAKTGSISGNNIRSLIEDNDGNLWIGTLAAGLNKFDREKQFFTSYKYDAKNNNSLGNNFVTSIHKDQNGELWVGTGGGGLNKFDKSKGEFIRYTHDSLDHNSISDNFILSVEKDRQGSLYIGTGNGLNKFDRLTGKFERIKIYPEKNNAREAVITFLIDKSEIMWISTYLDGLHKIYKQTEKFRSFLPGNNVKCIYEDKSGIWYIGTSNNGLEVSNDNGKTTTTYLNEKQNPNSISSNVINSVTEDTENNIWIGTNNGLNMLDKKTKKFSRFFNLPDDTSSLSSNNILKVLFDRTGTLWVGTDNGLNKLIKDSKKFIHYKYLQNDPYGLSENTVLSIYEDNENSLWVGTYKGLNRLDINTGKFRHYQQDPNNPKTISNNYVFSFCEDDNNNFWIGTGGGLNIFDRNTETFIHYTERDGLPNGVIAGLEYSADNYLWISTFKGISRFDIKNRIFKNYDADDGLQSNMFNTGSYFKSVNGEILFGGINGVNAFNPLMLKENQIVPSVIFTSLTKYDGLNKTEQDISGLEEIQLNYSENVINIDFASLDFTNPMKNQYSHMLEGFDKDWLTGKINHVVYTNLDPGEYIFKVKATNSDGVWNQHASSLKIIINPPFWKTWWFYGILICAVLAGIILIQNYRVRRKVKNLLQLEKIKEREREIMREQAARDYHDELGHKLTRISLYSRRINKKLRPGANGLTNDLNSIVETSNSLQSGAKDLIWAINPHEDSLYDLAVRLRDFGNELFDNTGINFSSEGMTDEFKKTILSMNCKRHLIYIFKEGMNNILKYSRCNTVNLNFHLNDDNLEIQLEDNGIGFDLNNCSKGYGLKNIFSRAAQINVNVNITSEENAGTIIKLKANILKLISA